MSQSICKTSGKTRHYRNHQKFLSPGRESCARYEHQLGKKHESLKDRVRMDAVTESKGNKRK